TTDDCSSGVQSSGPTPFLLSAIPSVGESSRSLLEADREVDRASDTHSGYMGSGVKFWHAVNRCSEIFYSNCYSTITLRLINNNKQQEIN
ncbi:hypothetical protein A2U01_0067204, partial [Trifolium medium]|nr:hypothetical protein [Trifolium medium]